MALINDVKYNVSMEDAEFDRLLKICRLRLSEKEREKIKKDVDEIIGYFNAVDRQNCDDAPAYHPVELKEKTREDKVERFEDVDGLLSNTKTYRGYVIGPKV